MFELIFEKNMRQTICGSNVFVLARFLTIVEIFIGVLGFLKNFSKSHHGLSYHEHETTDDPTGLQSSDPCRVFLC